MKKEVLGIPIKFRPIIGNLEHIKIVEKLGDLGDKYKIYKRLTDEGLEDGKKGKKILGEIRGLETTIQGMIGRANQNINAKTN